MLGSGEDLKNSKSTTQLCRSEDCSGREVAAKAHPVATLKSQAGKTRLQVERSWPDPGRTWRKRNRLSGQWLVPQRLRLLWEVVCLLLARILRR